MYKVRWGLLVSVLFGLHFLALAQEIRFLEKTHNFGLIQEEEGPVEYSFLFVNLGATDVQILDVEASCGCTTPGWSENLITPGDTGFITASFDPLNRPGVFEKTLGVKFKMGEGQSIISLEISGKVEPKALTLKEELTAEMGDLRFRYKSLNIGRVTTEKQVVTNFKVYNAGSDSITWLRQKSELPKYITVAFQPEVLAPEMVGELIVTYDPILRDDLGFLSDDIVLHTSEVVSEKRFSVTATIQEYFPELSEEELAMAPRLSFNQSQYDFGRVNSGTSVVTTFILSNTGKSDLTIRKTKTNCGCTISRLDQNKLAPGEEAQMEVFFDTTGRRGRQYKTITIFSDDPTAPTQMVTVKAEIAD